MYRRDVFAGEAACEGEPCSICSIAAPISCQPRVAERAKERNRPASWRPGPVSGAAPVFVRTGPARERGGPWPARRIVARGEPRGVGRQAVGDHRPGGLRGRHLAADQRPPLPSAAATATKSSCSSCALGGRGCAGAAAARSAARSASVSASASSAGAQAVGRQCRAAGAVAVRARGLGAEQVDHEHERCVRRDLRR